ncbi:hypothetical protein GGI12_005382 [Dipsacomyces acuminosporus]|nr:hypothetical protein GGI12_005382 [Dipsacomyces acuminosporus]
MFRCSLQPRRVAKISALSTVRNTAQRTLACLSVHVRYGTLKTTAADLKQVFEVCGRVWDVVPIESRVSGRLVQQALVRFYAGEYTPSESPGAAPVLPPPTASEIRAVEAAVGTAIEKVDGTEINGVKIRVQKANDDSPNQLHQWYEEQQLLDQTAGYNTRPYKDLFPVNPFHEPARLGDDYQRGFMAGFKLGLKDGSKPQ